MGCSQRRLLSTLLVLATLVIGTQWFLLRKRAVQRTFAPRELPLAEMLAEHGLDDVVPGFLFYGVNTVSDWGGLEPKQMAALMTVLKVTAESKKNKIWKLYTVVRAKVVQSSDVPPLAVYNQSIVSRAIAPRKPGERFMIWCGVWIDSPEWHAQARIGGAGGEVRCRDQFINGAAEVGYRTIIVRDAESIRAVWRPDLGDRLLMWIGGVAPLITQAELTKEESKAIRFWDFWPTDTDYMSFLSGGRGDPFTIHNVLTPYSYSTGNEFLGFWVENMPTRSKKKQGVFWGKEPRYYTKSLPTIIRLAELNVTMHAFIREDSLPKMPELPSNVVVHLHADKTVFHTILAESMFFLGLGDPLIGISAIEAVAAGCLYINPMFDIPRQVVTTRDLFFDNQHPPMQHEPQTCNFWPSRLKTLDKCVRRGLSFELAPVVPPKYTKAAFLQRIRDIFGDPTEPFDAESESILS